MKLRREKERVYGGGYVMHRYTEKDGYQFDIKDSTDTSDIDNRYEVIAQEKRYLLNRKAECIGKANTLNEADEVIAAWFEQLDYYASVEFNG